MFQLIRSGWEIRSAQLLRRQYCCCHCCNTRHLTDFNWMILSSIPMTIEGMWKNILWVMCALNKVHQVFSELLMLQIQCWEDGWNPERVCVAGSSMILTAMWWRWHSGSIDTVGSPTILRWVDSGRPPLLERMEWEPNPPRIEDGLERFIWVFIYLLHQSWHKQNPMQ